jgi:simple sugar transport system substrate-binding protein
LTTYPLFNTEQKTFQASASKLGFTARVAGSSTINIPQQIQEINEAVSSGAKAIVYYDLDPKSYTATIKAAEKKGVVFITAGSPDTISTYTVGTNNAALGVAAAQTIAKDKGTDAQVVVVMESATVPNQVASYNAFVAYAKAHYPNMKVLEQIDSAGVPSTTESDLAALPQSYPTANAVWFLEGGTLSAIQEGLTQAGKKPGQVFVLGIDALPTTLSLIKAGWISSTLAQCYFFSGSFEAQLALAKLQGHGPKKTTWEIPVQAVGKAQLPYHGCPASYIPKV